MRRGRGRVQDQVDRPAAEEQNLRLPRQQAGAAGLLVEQSGGSRPVHDIRHYRPENRQGRSRRSVMSVGTQRIVPVVGPDRLLNRISVTPGGCFLWLGAIFKKGYGYGMI